MKEEPSVIEKSLRDIYELGKEHGYKLAIKDFEIDRLKAEIDEINMKEILKEINK